MVEKVGVNVIFNILEPPAFKKHSICWKPFVFAFVFRLFGLFNFYREAFSE